MIDFENANIQAVSGHWVGNNKEDRLILSDDLIGIKKEELEQTLLYYFLSNFKSQETFCFYHESDLKFNEVYNYISNIFQNPEELYSESVNLAKFLFEKSSHPKISSGEFYVVYFKDTLYKGERMDIIGLFKSENKDKFIRTKGRDNSFGFELDRGININKIDKGCLIYNTKEEEGYIVSVIDNTNKSGEAIYWMDEFLHVKPCQDEYYNTSNLMSLCKNFVTKELPNQFEVTKADQVDLLNKSVKFFKENESFSMDKFEKEIISNQDVIDSFHNYKKEFQEDYGVEISDSFDISDGAVKKQSRVFRSVIKLDKNFHIYVHGNRDKIEQGMDEKGKFYKVYFEEES